MSIRYHQFCPISKAAEVLGERWTILIVRELILGTTHFCDLQRGLAQISPSLLTKRLHELQDAGLVIRKSSSDQRRTEYHLTPAGKELLAVLTDLGQWGMKWARGQMSDDELDVELLMTHLSKRLDPTQLPTGRTVIEFIFPGLTHFARWWILVKENRERELCVERPGDEADIQIRADLRTITEVFMGDTELSAARNQGRLQLSGNPVLIQSIRSWLRTALFAATRPHPDSLKKETAPSARLRKLAVQS